MDRRNFFQRAVVTVAAFLGVKRLTKLEPILDGGSAPLGWIGSGVGPIPGVDSTDVLQVYYPPGITSPRSGDAFTQFREAAERYNDNVTAFSAPGVLQAKLLPGGHVRIRLRSDGPTTARITCYKAYPTT